MEVFLATPQRQHTVRDTEKHDANDADDAERQHGEWRRSKSIKHHATHSISSLRYAHLFPVAVVRKHNEDRVTLACSEWQK